MYAHISRTHLSYVYKINWEFLKKKKKEGTCTAILFVSHF